MENSERVSVKFTKVLKKSKLVNSSVHLESAQAKKDINPTKESITSFDPTKS